MLSIRYCRLNYIFCLLQTASNLDLPPLGFASGTETLPTGYPQNLVPDIIDLTEPADATAFPSDTQRSGSPGRSPSAFSTKSPIYAQTETTSASRGRGRGRGRGRPPKTEDKTPTCRYRGCGATFNSKEDVKQHVAQYHAGNAEESVCSECGQGFSSTQGLKFHMSKHTGRKMYIVYYILVKYMKEKTIVIGEVQIIEKVLWKW